jgi:hypothetical protein
VRESPSTSCASVPTSNAVKPAASTAQIVAMVRSVMRGVCRGRAPIQAHSVDRGPIRRLAAGSQSTRCGKIYIRIVVATSAGIDEIARRAVGDRNDRDTAEPT